MKRANNLIEKIADPDNLRLAFWKARKGKSYAKEVQHYRRDLDNNLLQLRQQILAGEVVVGDYRFFKIYEPKEREICASAFREQVLHHALMNICHEFFERKQIYDSYASRKGKGTYAALLRSKKHTHRYEFYLKLDVRKFFASIAHEFLKQQLQRIFKDEMLLHIFEQIIDSYPRPEQRGLPIGNLTSQYFANHYLCGLDHFIKEKLQVKAYVRYMDDMILWSDEKGFLKECLERITIFLTENLGLQLKTPSLQRTSRGLPFLGYLVFPYHTQLRQQSKRRFIRKLLKLQFDYENQILPASECQRKVLPLLAFTNHADCKKLRTKLLLGLENKGQSSKGR